MSGTSLGHHQRDHHLRPRLRLHHYNLLLRRQPVHQHQLVHVEPLRRLLRDGFLMLNERAEVR